MGLPLDVPVEEAHRDSVALGLTRALPDAEPKADALGVGRVLDVAHKVKGGELLSVLLPVTLLLAHSVEETLAYSEEDTELLGKRVAESTGEGEWESVGERDVDGVLQGQGEAEGEGLEV